MTQMELLIIGGIYILSVTFAAAGIRWYEEAAYKALNYSTLKVGWVAKARYLWMGILVLWSLVGFFTVVEVRAGFYMQPPSLITRPIDWPDPDEINHLSRDWTHPDTLIAYQDDTTHIRFMHRYNLPSGTLLHSGPDILVKP